MVQWAIKSCYRLETGSGRQTSGSSGCRGVISTCYYNTKQWLPRMSKIWQKPGGFYCIYFMDAVIDFTVDNWGFAEHVDAAAALHKAQHYSTLYILLISLHILICYVFSVIWWNRKFIDNSLKKNKHWQYLGNPSLYSVIWWVTLFWVTRYCVIVAGYFSMSVLSIWGEEVIHT